MRKNKQSMTNLKLEALQYLLSQVYIAAVLKGLWPIAMEMTPFVAQGKILLQG